MKKTLTLIVTVCLTFAGISQNSQSINLTRKVFELKTEAADFRTGKVFLTLDTINAMDVMAPSTFIETTDPTVVINRFNNFMRITKFTTRPFFYKEINDSPFYESGKHIVFFINDANYTYRIDLWPAKEDITKLEGLSVCKNLIKISPYALN